jgi:holo-[acyl-carrier protein] synthase
MPIRVGIDLTSVTGVRESIGAHGERYLKRVYTDAELAECRTGDGVDAERLAARFAVKEAAMKVLRPTEHDAVPWTEIEVRHADASDAVEVELSGRAFELAAASGIGELTASLTHEAEFAAAVVVAEMNSGGDGG